MAGGVQLQGQGRTVARAGGVQLQGHGECSCKGRVRAVATAGSVQLQEQGSAGNALRVSWLTQVFLAMFYNFETASYAQLFLNSISLSG